MVGNLTGVHPTVRCTPCKVSFPEFDPELARKCPNCHGWFDHVPEDLRTGPEPFDVSPGDDSTEDNIFTAIESTPSRYLMVIEGDGSSAARLLEEAGFKIETVTEAPRKIVRGGKEEAPVLVDWKSLALWLAGCHAINAEHEGRLVRTSKSSAARMRRICRQAAEAIEGGPNPGTQQRYGPGGDPIGPEQTAPLLEQLRRGAEE